MHGAAIETAVFAWNCGIPDAWYPDLGWVEVPGGPQDVQRAIDEMIRSSDGRSIPAGSVAVVEQVDNVWMGNSLHIGSPEAPMHLWAWRPPSAPELPPPPSREDAEHLVVRFLDAWGRSETYLSPMATQDVWIGAAPAWGVARSPAGATATGAARRSSRPSPASSRSPSSSAPRRDRPFRSFSSSDPARRPMVAPRT